MKDIILFRKKFGLPILLLFLIPSIMMLLVVTAWGEETALPPLFSEEDSVLPPFSEENAALRRKTKMTAAGNGAIGRRIGTAPGTVQAMRHLPRIGSCGKKRIRSRNRIGARKRIRRRAPLFRRKNRKKNLLPPQPPLKAVLPIH